MIRKLWQNYGDLTYKRRETSEKRRGKGGEPAGNRQLMGEEGGSVSWEDWRMRNRFPRGVGPGGRGGVGASVLCCCGHGGGWRPEGSLTAQTWSFCCTPFLAAGAVGRPYPGVLGQGSGTQSEVRGRGRARGHLPCTAQKLSFHFDFKIIGTAFSFCIGVLDQLKMYLSCFKL